MPINLYGRGDNYHPEYSHVVAALIRRFHEAKVSAAKNVVVWGTGTPRREFLYVDDLADACVYLMKTYSSPEFVNIGTGEDITIAEFVRVVAATVGYTGEINFDPSRPDGTPRKLLECQPTGKARLAREHVAGGGDPARLSGVSQRIKTSGGRMSYHSGWSEGPDLRWTIAHRGISRFRVRFFEIARNDITCVAGHGDKPTSPPYAAASWPA